MKLTGKGPCGDGAQPPAPIARSRPAVPGGVDSDRPHPGQACDHSLSTPVCRRSAGSAQSPVAKTRSPAPPGSRVDLEGLRPYVNYKYISPLRLVKRPSGRTQRVNFHAVSCAGIQLTDPHVKVFGTKEHSLRSRGQRQGPCPGPLRPLHTSRMESSQPKIRPCGDR